MTFNTDKIITQKISVSPNEVEPVYPVDVKSDEDEDINYIGIGWDEDKTRGFEIDIAGEYKRANYIFKWEDGDTQYFASGNSGRDILAMQSWGRVGINVPTLLGNIEILRIVQTGSNTYATITCETPHRLSNNTPITIEWATETKFNGNFVITNITTMTFRINGLSVGAVTEEPTAAKVVMATNIPAAFAIFPQYFDSVYAFDKALDTGAGTGYTNITGQMRTSFLPWDVIVPVATGSYLYLGKKYPRRATSINMETASVGGSAIVVEYSTASWWTALSTSTTSGNSLVDTTNRLRQDWTITRDLKSFKSLWKQQILQTNPAPQYTQNLYWIRISLTGTITTAPTAKSVSNHGVDRFAIYAQSWDVSPALVADSVGRVWFLPPELETKYNMWGLTGLTTSKFEVVAEDWTRSDFVYYLANSASDQHPAVIYARSWGTVAAKTAVINGMDIWWTYGFAYDGSQFREIASIKFEAASAASAGNVSGRMVWFVRNTTNTSAERWRVDENGNFAINNTTPRSKLDVNGWIRMANDVDTASANKAGTLRYRADANNSYVDMCMQTGASTYSRVNIKTNTW